MKNMRFLVVAGLTMLAVSACADLNVVNQNDPDRERALATPGDVESLISGAYRTWWFSQHGWAPGPALSVGADQHTASWGNFMMKDFSHEPRLPINNSPSYGYSYVVESPYFGAYSALAAVRDGLLAINGGLQIGEDGADTPRAKAFAKFIQGLSLGTVALLYDKAFILDENADIENATFSPYNEVMAAAISSLEEAISIASSNSFSTPDAWMSGAHTSDELVRLMHSYIARFMAEVPRTPAERDAVDWNAVLNHINQGVTQDFTVFGDDVNWWDILKTYTEYRGWGRVDVRTVGPADQSGAFQNWMATPVDQRNEFLIDTDDRRITNGDPKSMGLYFGYAGPSQFKPERGTYHFSMYGSYRYDDYNTDWVGDMPELTVKEMDFLKAEALYRTGNKQGAVDIINTYRTTNGQLPPATLDGAKGQDRCVPRMPDGSCGDLWETIKYEKRVEVWHTFAGDAFYDDRGWGDLVTGTAIQFPIPGKELLTLLMDIYTFGGSGEGAAPAEIIHPTFTPQSIAARVRTFRRIADSNGKAAPVFR